MAGAGSILKTERELRQISLEEVAQVTRIPLMSLRALEDDDYASLPGNVFVRGFLRSYARALDLDAGEVLAAHAGQTADRDDPVEEMPAPLGSIQAHERGKRLGIAVALAILLLLFTLALSVVLRPRRLDAPVELSETSAPASTASQSNTLA